MCALNERSLNNHAVNKMEVVWLSAGNVQAGQQPERSVAYDR